MIQLVIQRKAALLVVLCGVCGACTSARWRRAGPEAAVDSDFSSTDMVATRIDYPEPWETDVPVRPVGPPRTLDSGPPTDFRELTLQEAILVGLQQSQVLRDLGGGLLSTPETTDTIYDPAIRTSDPQFGVEGALSAFDAQLSTGLFWQKNDRVFNNRVAGGGINQFQQDLATFRTEISKVAATGTRFSMRSLTRYDDNNSPLSNRLFLNSWDSEFVASVRQPLLQGAGVLFNRIAGPNAQPGVNSSTGVVLARLNTDISLAEFEAGVRDYVSQLEDAYWELYFAYHELDAVTIARDNSLRTWQSVKARYDQDLIGGEAYREARARAQYYQFENLVQDVLNGARNRTSGVRSQGVYTAERRLRWLMGLPTNDVQMLRPVDEPSIAHVMFDWDAAHGEAMERRVELRRQMWQVKRRELEALVARNFVRPRLDAVVDYRLRGFGDDLTGDGARTIGEAADAVRSARFSSAFQDLGTWDHQEWEAGLQFDMPLGFRQGWAAVRKADLQLARERAILAEQRNRVALDLSEAIAEASRAHAAVRVGYNRLAAAQADTQSVTTAYDNDQATVELVLESEQRLANAASLYYRSLADYGIALKDVHLQKGSLLQYDGVLLSEGPWPANAYADAAELAERWPPKKNPRDWVVRPRLMSSGPYQQTQAFLSSDAEPIEVDVEVPVVVPVEADDEDGEVPSDL